MICVTYSFSTIVLTTIAKTVSICLSLTPQILIMKYRVSFLVGRVIDIDKRELYLAGCLAAHMLEPLSNILNSEQLELLGCEGSGYPFVMIQSRPILRGPVNPANAVAVTGL